MAALRVPLDDLTGLETCEPVGGGERWGRGVSERVKGEGGGEGEEGASAAYHGTGLLQRIFFA